MNTNNPTQTSPTYYSYAQKKPFYKRLLGLQNVWSPYCANCHKWVKTYDRMLGISIPKNVLHERAEAEVVKSLSRQDWDVLNMSERPCDWSLDQPTIFISLARCDICDSPFAVLGEIRGKKTSKAIVLGGLFSMEIDKNSALALLELAVKRDLPVNEAMRKKAIDFCQSLGSSCDFAELALARRRKEKAMELCRQGIADLRNGLLDQAEANFTNALRLFEELGEINAQAFAYRDLGTVYYEGRRLDRAEAFWKTSLELFEKFHDKPEIARCQGCLGTLYLDIKQFEQAEAFLQKALAIEMALDNKKGMAMAYRSSGDAHKALGDKSQAKDDYGRALRLWKELGEKALVKTMQAELDGLGA